MDKSKPCVELEMALGQFQAKCPTMRKDTKGHNYTYATLPQIVEKVTPLLMEQGLVFMQHIESDNAGNVGVRSVLTHESGEHVESSIYVDLETCAKGGTIKNPIQALGSITTYLRRYAMSSMLGIVADKDDDGADSGRFESPVTLANSFQIAGIDKALQDIAGRDTGKLESMTAAMKKQYNVSHWRDLSESKAQQVFDKLLEKAKG